MADDRPTDTTDTLRRQRDALAETLRELVALVELSDEANRPGTDLYTEVHVARELLKEIP